jgi:integrase
MSVATQTSLQSTRKIGKRYYAYFYNPQKDPARKSFPLGTTRKRVAEKKARKLEEEVASGEFDPWDPLTSNHSSNPSLEHAIGRFMDTRSRLRPKTIATYKSALNLLLQAMPVGMKLRHVSAKDVDRYVQSGNVRESTRAQRYRHIRTFFNWAEKNGLIETNPIDAVPEPKPGRRIPEFLTETQVDAVLDEIQRDFEAKHARGEARQGQILWLKDVVDFAVHTGLRAGEIVHLRWYDVDLETGYITVRNIEASDSHDGFRTKSGHERSIPIVGRARRVLVRLEGEHRGSREAYVFKGFSGYKLNASYMSKQFKHYVREAELSERFRFHSLRHTFASWLAQSGASIAIISKILGHSSTEVTQKYAHLIPSASKNVMEKIFD